jgi:CoA:oxalate CoA-transferase
MGNTKPGPLADFRILDLSMFVAGPFGTATLAELGADVIKVEPPGGDPVRQNNVGPSIAGESAQFHTYNHDKRSVILDLKNEAGRNIFFDLAAASDVVFANFRPGVMERLGLT